mgnify:FL=1
MPIEVFTAENINACAEENRRFAYKQETDPLFMQVQRGEISSEEWQVAVQNIKDRFPYVTEDVSVEYPDYEPEQPQTEGTVALEGV